MALDSVAVTRTLRVELRRAHNLRPCAPSRPSRHYASPTEAAAALEAAGDDRTRVCVRAWRDVQFIGADLSGAGVAMLPPLAFHGIASTTGGEAEIAETPVRASERRVPISDGTIWVKSASESFEYQWTASHRLDWACISHQLVVNMAEASGVVEPERTIIETNYHSMDASCGHLLHVLAEEARVGEHTAQQLVVESVATALACRLLVRFSSSRGRIISTPGALGAHAFRRVHSYIVEHIGQRISLGDLARTAGVSRYHFARQFRLRTGESPMGYLLRLRVERAKELLALSGTRIAEIALTLGFADQSHFTRIFRRFVGVTPGEFGRQSTAGTAVRL